MSEKLRAIRWLGSAGVSVDAHGSAYRNGIPSGVLHLGKRIVHPGEEIKDPAELSLLGAARIEELCFMLQAQYLDSSPRPKEDISDGTTQRERALAAEAIAAGIKYTDISKAIFKADLENGFVDAKGELTPRGKARVALAQGGFSSGSSK
jgi:hypothetical protein